MPPTDRRATGFAAILSLALVLAWTAAPPLWAQSRQGQAAPAPSDELCWQDCGAREREDPGMLGTRIRQSPGGQPEDVLTGPPAERAAAERAIADAGGRVLRAAPLPALGLVTQIAVFPGLAARERARARLSRTAPRTGMSPNWTYGFAQTAGGPRLYAPALIGDPGPGRCRLSRPLRIGMIDGPVNTAHPALRGAQVRVETLVGGGRTAADHGTAVAALLVGEDPDGSLAGFARGAELHAVAAFAREGGRDETSVERILLALELLVGRDVRLINMSFAGPRSPALRAGLAAAAARGVLMVGASGNDGVRQVAYPAEAAEVIAVTAVDSARRRYRRANFGNEVEIAAPGVDLYVALGRGGGYGSGTSFAAPIVTALLARDMARGIAGADTLRSRLRAGAEPLGDRRRNEDFGYGLARAASC